MSNGLKTIIENLSYPIHEMVGVSERANLRVESVPGPTTAVTLKVTLAEDPRKHYFVKTIKKDALPGPHLNLGLREVRFYAFMESLGIDPPPYLPKCLNRFIAKDEKGYFLVLEDLSKTHEGYEGIDFSNPDRLKAPISALAHFHRFFTGKLTTAQISSNVDGPGAVESYIQKLEKAFLNFKEDFHDVVDDYVLSLMERSIPLIHVFELEKLERIIQNKLTTILHRDAHLKNFLYPRSADGNAMIVDWQFWGLGIGAFDLRHLLGIPFQDDLLRLQEDLVRYYYDTYMSGLDIEYTWANCWDDYRKGIIDNLFMPVWQYSGFGWTYERWGKSLSTAVGYYDALGCAELEKRL